MGCWSAFCNLPLCMAAIRSGLRDSHSQVAYDALDCLMGLLSVRPRSLGVEERRELEEPLKAFFTHSEGVIRSNALNVALRPSGGDDEGFLKEVEKALKDPDSHARMEASSFAVKYGYLPALPILATHGPDMDEGGYNIDLEGPGGDRWGVQAWGSSSGVESYYVEAVEKLSTRLTGIPPFKIDRTQARETFTFRLIYPKSQARAYDPVISRLESSFKPGSLDK